MNRIKRTIITVLLLIILLIQPASASDWIAPLFANGFIGTMLIFCAFAGIGLEIGGIFGAIAGFLLGFAVCIWYGLLPSWTIFVFGLIVVVIATSLGTSTGGSNE